MEAVLNFETELDVGLLDRVVQSFYLGSGVEVRATGITFTTADKIQQKQAQTVLTQFQEHPNAWTRVDAILEGSSNAQSKCE